MKIAIIGASGFVGSALREEALQRGHQVAALVSRPERLEPAASLEVAPGKLLLDSPNFPMPTRPLPRVRWRR